MPRVTPRPRFENLAELLHSLGGVPLDRVCLDPAPGHATKADLVRLCAKRGKLYELVDGTLVEKPMGHPESFLALELGRVLGNLVHESDLGYCTGADDLVEVMPQLVRGPDVSFYSWDRQPERTVPGNAISKVIPDLVVEILSPKNTRGEILRKLKEYFLGGVRVVWVIDPRKRTAAVYTAPDAKTILTAADILDGGAVLPGFRLPLAKLFEKLEQPAKRKRK